MCNTWCIKYDAWCPWDASELPLKWIKQYELGRLDNKLTGTDGRAGRRAGGQDHVLSQADALTKKEYNILYCVWVLSTASPLLAVHQQDRGCLSHWPQSGLAGRPGWIYGKEYLAPGNIWRDMKLWPWPIWPINKGASIYYIINFWPILDPPLRHQDHHGSGPPTPPKMMV